MKILEKTSTKLTLRYRPLELWIVAGSIGLVIPLLLLIVASTNTWIFYLWWFPVLPLLFIVLGLLLLIYVGQVVTCTFDKILGRVTIKQQSLLKTKVINCAIKEIIDVEVSSKTQGANPTYQIVLVLKSGHALPVNLDNKSSWQDKQKVVDPIREFLGLSPKQFFSSTLDKKN